MKILTILVAAMTLPILSVAACHPAPKPPKTPESAAPSASTSVSATPGASDTALAPNAPNAAMRAAFYVNDLGDDDANIMGCTTMLFRGNDAPRGQIFAEDGVDSDGVGFIKINDQVIKLALTSSTHSDKGGVRIFSSADKTMVVTENYLIGASHEESDSVDLKGTLDVSYKGELQSFIVNGGTAC